MLQLREHLADEREDHLTLVYQWRIDAMVAQDDFDGIKCDMRELRRPRPLRVLSAKRQPLPQSGAGRWSDSRSKPRVQPDEVGPGSLVAEKLRAWAETSVEARRAPAQHQSGDPEKPDQRQ